MNDDRNCQKIQRERVRESANRSLNLVVYVMLP